jgi:hypothetical protein
MRDQLAGKDFLRDLDVDGTTILKRILNPRLRGCGQDSSGSRLGPVADCLKKGDGLPNSIKGRQYLD